MLQWCLLTVSSYRGYQWAGSILAFLALVMIPIPFILDRYGLQLRKRSPWAREHMDAFSGEQTDSRMETA